MVLSELGFRVSLLTLGNRLNPISMVRNQPRVGLVAKTLCRCSMSRRANGPTEYLERRYLGLPILGPSILILKNVFAFFGRSYNDNYLFRLVFLTRPSFLLIFDLMLVLILRSDGTLNY